MKQTILLKGNHDEDLSSQPSEYPPSGVYERLLHPGMLEHVVGFLLTGGKGG